MAKAQNNIQVVMLDKFQSIVSSPDGNHVFIECNVSNNKDRVAVHRDDVMRLIMGLAAGLRQCDTVSGHGDALWLMRTEGFEIASDAETGKGLLKMDISGGGRLDFDLQEGMLEYMSNVLVQSFPRGNEPTH